MPTTKSRKSPQLGFGDYISRGDRPDSVMSTSRRDLLRASNRVFPSFAARLASDVFPVYCDAVGSGFNSKIIWSHNPYWSIEAQGGLKTALLQWATTFNALAEWLLDTALRTMDGWRRVPEWRARHQWDTLIISSSEVVCGKPFTFAYNGWELQSFTWPVYCESVRRQFESALADYEKSARLLAQSEGLRRSPRNHSPINFDWFVLYQFAGMASTEIASRPEYVKYDPTTIMKGVKVAANLIGWNLRGRKTTVNGNHE